MNAKTLTPSAFGSEIVREVSSWPKVTVADHQFGGTEFNVGRRQLGHIHGNSAADIPFSRKRRDALIAEGRAREHRWVPDSGWVTVRMRTPEDVENVISLFRENYDAAMKLSHGSEEKKPAARRE